jgi:endo-1,3(4)-beta-glucanase
VVSGYPDDRLFGPEVAPGRASFYYSAQHDDFGIGAMELDGDDCLPREEWPKVESFDALGLSVRTVFEGHTASEDRSLAFPIVRGMAYVTALFRNLTPRFVTEHGITEVNGHSWPPKGNLTVTSDTFTIRLDNQQVWSLYSLNGSVTLMDGGPLHVPAFRDGETGKVAFHTLKGHAPLTGVLRAALVPDKGLGGDQTILHAHKHVWPVSCALKAEAAQEEGAYTLEWGVDTVHGHGGTHAHTTGGLFGPSVKEELLLHYALPHHQNTLRETAAHDGRKTTLQAMSATKGTLVAIKGQSWTLEEPELTTIDWLPPRPPQAAHVASIGEALVDDITNTDFAAASNQYDNYFSGKALYKFAQLCLVADALGETDLRDRCIRRLQAAFAPFVQGRNQNPLAYDTTWKGLVGARGVSQPPCDDVATCPAEERDSWWRPIQYTDFGSSYYNDHHYHWGYFIQTAAILYRFDPNWGRQHTAWVQTLIRDVSNPSAEDPHFVTWRSFDWFCGHSWSQGLFANVDGKDEESTAEEINYHYGVMLWGMASGNVPLERLGRLMLGVATRATQMYFLMDRNNTVHPPEYVGNRVTGIYMENKCDYKTWFGPNPDYIHGIQMIPMTPISEEVRTLDFVRDEWPLLDGIARSITHQWKSVLYMNYAVLDPKAAFKVLQTASLDDGLTRTWALFWASTREAVGPLPPFVPECTLGGLDPYLYGAFVSCCEGSSLCLRKWGGRRENRYLCVVGDDCAKGAPTSFKPKRPSSSPLTSPAHPVEGGARIAVALSGLLAVFFMAFGVPYLREQQRLAASSASMTIV